MVGESRKWITLIATTWIQAFTGTNFDFSSYSSTLKSILGMSQLQLNYLSVASDLGKAFGWCFGVLLLYFPLWVLMFMASFMGLFGYGLQWLLAQKLIDMPYSLVFLLCVLSGCSICWFNTACFVLCIRNFPTNRPLALSLTIGYNGLSAALYTLIAKAINPEDNTIYLLLNALIPLFTTSLALIPILRQPPSQQPSTDTIAHDRSIFLILNVLALITGLYLLLLNTLSSDASTARILFARALFLLFLPLCLPTIVYAKNWACRSIPTSFHFDRSSFNLVDINDLQQLIGSEQSNALNILEEDRSILPGEEHPARLLVRNWDFWLYYLTYFCAGTTGLVFSNNLGQIAESLGYYSRLSSLITIYSTCSFFGRLLSAAPDFLHDKLDFTRTGWLAVAVLATPIAFLLLIASGSEVILHTSTGLIGLSSGFTFSAAVSITSELFGPESASVNHNILITNIPIGSLLYGLLAALVYDNNAGSSIQESLLHETSVCMGRQCYLKTFIWWASISLLGHFSSFALFLRTRPAYDRSKRNQN